MEFISSDQFKEAHVVKHHDRWCVVFGYTRTRKAPGVYVDGFEPAYHTPERKYKTEAGAVRAARRWING